MKICAIIAVSAILLTAIMLGCIWTAVDTSEWDPKGYDGFDD